jgi:hypothetical protein
MKDEGYGAASDARNLHPSSFILHPSSFILHPSYFAFQIPRLASNDTGVRLLKNQRFTAHHESNRLNQNLSGVITASPAHRAGLRLGMN